MHPVNSRNLVVVRSGVRERRSCRGALIALSLAAIATAHGSTLHTGAYHIASAYTRQASLSCFLDVPCPNLAVEQWIVNLPYADAVPGQSSVSNLLIVNGRQIPSSKREELSPLRRPVLRMAIEGQSLPSEYRVEGRYLCTLSSRRLEAGQGDITIDPLTPAEVRLSLRDSATTDFNAKPFQKFLKVNALSRAKDERDLDYASRALDSMISMFKARQDAAADPKASVTARTLTGDSGRLSVLYVAALRANGIPSRVRDGCLLNDDTPGTNPTTSVNYYTTAEFFANGVGWVPVDVYKAVAARSANGAFGVDNGRQVTFFVDTDAEVDLRPYQIAKDPLLTMRAHHLVHGVGQMDPEKVKCFWVVWKNAPAAPDSAGGVAQPPHDLGRLGEVGNVVSPVRP